MKALLTSCAVFAVLAVVARAIPQGTGSSGSGAGREACERWRKDQAAVYRNLRRRVLSGEIANGEDLMRFFAFCRTKVEPNAAGPLGPALGEIVGKKFDRTRIADAAGRLESEFAP
jgi:hypothetical protein